MAIKINITSLKRYYPECAILISYIYWFYLASTTQMIIVYDAQAYESIAYLIKDQGWAEFFKTGPQREPLYPFLISVCMRIGNSLGVSYQSIVVIFQLSLLAVTQRLIKRILVQLQIQSLLQAAILLYIGISPVLVNSALRLFSEVVTYPLSVVLVLVLVGSWSMLTSSNIKMNKILSHAFIVAIISLLFVFVKGVFEIIYIFLLMPFLILAMQQLRMPYKINARHTIIFFLFSLFIFYSGVWGYKYLNKTYNGNFVLTDRGSFMIYGNTIRRLDRDGLKYILGTLTYGSDGLLCKAIWGEDYCLYWSHVTADKMGIPKLTELSGQMSNEQAYKKLIDLTIQRIIQEPLKYFFISLLELPGKFQWESTLDGFVVYPEWMQRLFHTAGLNWFVHLFIFIVTIVSFGSFGNILWHYKLVTINEQMILKFYIFYLILLYIFMHSFVCFFLRYILPIVPLYLIVIAIWLDNKFYK